MLVPLLFRRVLALGLAGAAALGAGACTAPAPPGAAPQWSPDSASVRVAAGPQYARGAVWRFLWGQHYRDIWATPVTAPVLRLASAVPDTLTPTQTGGSYQSRTLRLCTPTGREFVLRSVDKDARGALRAGWLRALLGGLLKDQTSAGQPYGAYAAAALAEAAGVYHTHPALVYVADDPCLGRFRSGYANALYLLEERPDGDEQGTASFGHSPAVVNSRHMLASLCQQPTARADARAYLRARLLDLWLGDWSRRPDQWRWASFRLGGHVRYRPIPRDRDQAFFLFDDGLLTGLISLFVAKYNSFHATLPLRAVAGLSVTARALDRTLLAPLGAEDFRQEADSLRRRLTDAAIARALAQAPPEVRPALTAQLGPRLRARRAQLAAVARRYYEVVSEEAWLVGTDQAERFVVSGAGAGRVRVQVLARRPGRPDSLLAARTYNRHDTHLLKLYGLGGDDVFELHGQALPPGVAVQLYDGAGHDRVLCAAPTALGYITWYGSADGDARRAPSGLPTVPDPHPELSVDAAGWLRNYNLRD